MSRRVQQSSPHIRVSHMLDGSQQDLREPGSCALAPLLWGILSNIRNAGRLSASRRVVDAHRQHVSSCFIHKLGTGCRYEDLHHRQVGCPCSAGTKTCQLIQVGSSTYSLGHNSKRGKILPPGGGAHSKVISNLSASSASFRHQVLIVLQADESEHPQATTLSDL